MTDDSVVYTKNDLDTFCAEAVKAAIEEEREDCARLCDEDAAHLRSYNEHEYEDIISQTESLAERIRERGEGKV